MGKITKTLCVSMNETFLEGLKNSLKSENLELTFFLLKKDNSDELTKLTSSINILVLHMPETIDHEFIQRFTKDQYKLMIIGPKTLNNVTLLIKNKIDGYVYSEDSMKHIIKTITLLAVQEKSFSNAVAQDLLNHSGLQDKLLTATEKKLINLIARGYDTNSIAEQVGCTANTIGVHKHNIKLKLNIKTKDFLQYCMKNSL